MAYMTKKQKRGNILIPFLIILGLSLVVIYKLELDSVYHISVNITDENGEQHEFNNKDLRKSLNAKTEEVRDATQKYFD